MNDVLFCTIFYRHPDGTLIPRGGALPCISASGGSYLSRIGYGKVSLPWYLHFSLAGAQQAQPDDLCVAWTIAPEMNVGHFVCAFIVKARQYRDGEFHLSGPDMLGELQDAVAFARVGGGETVQTTARSLGSILFRVPEPDVMIALDAAYPPRTYTTVDFTDSGDIHIIFTEQTTAQIGDTFRVMSATPGWEGYGWTPWETTVAGHSDERTRLEITDPLPLNLPAGAQVKILTRRLPVAHANAFVAGEEVLFQVREPGGGGGPGQPQLVTMIIDRITLSDNPQEPDYLYFREPITYTVAAGATVAQRTYTLETTEDIALLFQNSVPQWGVWRSPLATKGTSYAPDGEPVWDALTAIANTAGYIFRLAPPIELPGGTGFLPRRRVEYFPAGQPETAGPLTLIGTQNRVASYYGEIIELQTEDANEIVTHVAPFGGGGGNNRFGIGEAGFDAILPDYPGIGWGVRNRQYYVYNAGLASVMREVWRTEVFEEISPEDESNDNLRRLAANRLLRAACEFLQANATTDRTYSATIYTQAEPRPGDLLPAMSYSGVEPFDITLSNLVLSEVHHSVEADGLRETKLIINRNAEGRIDGNLAVAKALSRIQRIIRHGNIGTTGGTNLTSTGATFGGGAVVEARGGDMGVTSSAGDVVISAPQGDVNLTASTLNVIGRIETNSDVKAASFTLVSETTSETQQVTAFTLRGIPRLKVRSRRRAS